MAPVAGLYDPITELAATTVATAPSPPTSGTLLTLAAGRGVDFPVGSFYATVAPAGTLPGMTTAEIVRATRAGGSDVLTITRAQLGTTARSIAAGDVVTAGPTGAEIRKLQNSTSVFDVRAFGAVCDDTTDDGAAVRAAVAAASAAGGGTVLISGLCRITSTVTSADGTTVCGLKLPSKVALAGTGRENSWLRKDFTGGILVDHSGTATGFANHVNISSIRDVTLRGTGTSTGTLLRCYYADNLFVHNTRFTQHAGVGLDAVEFWDSYFVSCTWENFNGNDGASPCIRVRNASAAAGFGSSTDNSNMLWFANCRFEAFVDGGLWVQRGDASNTNNPNGIFLTHAKFESHSVAGGTLPKGRFLYFDDATMLCGVDKADFFVGSFIAGNTTPVVALTCNAVASVTLDNLRFICTEAAGTLQYAIDFFTSAGPAYVGTIEHRGNAPTGALINWAGGNGLINTSKGKHVVAAGTLYSGAPPGDLPEHTSTTPASPASSVTMFTRTIAGRRLPAFVGPAGLDSALQPLLGRNRVCVVQPVAGSTTVTAQGFALSTTGTATAAAAASTNLHTSLARIDYLVTTAATTAVAGWRGSTNGYWFGNAAGLGGFTFICRWSPATGQSTTTSRHFVGMSNNTGAPTDVQPSSLTNMFGVGWDAADTNMQFMTNDGTGTATKVDLGGSFAVPTTDRPGVWELAMFAAPNSSVLNWQVTNVGTGAVASGTATTDRPSNTTFLSPRGYASVGGTNSVIGTTLFGLYVETDL